jgi:transposase
MYTIGCDQHKHYCVLATLNEQGKMMEQQKFYHDSPEVIKDYLLKMPEGSKLAIEACGYDAWLCDLVESCGVKVHLAHPLKTKAIASARIKTDTLDAKVLAQLLHNDFLAEAYYAPKELREKRYLLRYRQCLVQYQTSLKNRIHGILDRLGIRTPEVTDLFGKKGIAWLKSLDLTDVYANALEGYLEVLSTIKERIKESEKNIQAILDEAPQTTLLQTIPGIGKISAFLLIAEIGPIERFASAEKLCSYAGLVPSLHQSGQTLYQGSITKQGNKFIRWVMVEAAHRALRQDPALRNLYQRIERKKGSSKAAVAVARKLLTYVWHVLTKNEIYRYRTTVPNKPVVSRA